MNKFNIYVMKLFIKNLIIAFLFISLMTALSAAYGNFSSLSGYEYSVIDFLILAIYGVTLGINQLMPIIAAVAVIVTILILMRNNELLAFMTIGGSIARLAVPFVLIGILLTCIMLFFEYEVVPQTRDLRENKLDTMKGKKPKKVYGFYDMWLVGSDGVIINIGVADISSSAIYGAREFIIGSDNTVSKIINMEKIRKKDGVWIAENMEIKDISVNPPKIERMETAAVHNKIWEQLVSFTTNDIRGFTPTELITMIRILREKGANTAEYEMSLYFKFASAVSVVVLILFMFPIAINFSRNYSIMKNAALTFSFALVFVLSQYIGKSLGDTGVFSPITAAFGPIFIFLCLSFVLIYMRSRAR